MTPSHLGSNLPQANGPYGHSGQMGMQQHGPPPMRVRAQDCSYNSIWLPSAGMTCQHGPATRALQMSRRNCDTGSTHLKSCMSVQMGGNNMMMNSGMIPIGAHAPSGASPMVPVGGMPQNNRHMHPGMQGDYGGV